jgi:hypothetical protein
MRFMVIVAATLIFAMPLAAGAFAQTAQRPAAPDINQTQDAKIKEEYLQSKPYVPCPADVRFSNGRQACLGLPWYPRSGRDRHDDPNE